MKTDKLNRFEIIDHTMCKYCLGAGIRKDQECEFCGGIGSPGRSVIVWDDKKQIDIEIQDDGKTLKVFIHDKYED